MISDVRHAHKYPTSTPLPHAHTFYLAPASSHPIDYLNVSFVGVFLFRPRRGTQEPSGRDRTTCHGLCWLYVPRTPLHHIISTKEEGKVRLRFCGSCRSLWRLRWRGFLELVAMGGWACGGKWDVMIMWEFALSGLLIPQLTRFLRRDRWWKSLVDGRRF